MSGEDDIGVTPPKQHKPNESVPIIVAREEIVETNNDLDDIDEVIEEPQIIIVPPECQTPEVIAVAQTFKEMQTPAEDEQYNTDDSESIVSDDGERDIQNMKEILIVSDLDSDDYDEEENSDDTGASDNELEPYQNDQETPIDVDKMKKVLTVSELDSDDDSCCDGGSEDSDENNGLPADWQMNCPPGGSPFYYHIPSGAVTSVRPKAPGHKKYSGRTMGYELNEEY